jgi:hypothetical protein
MRKLRRGGVRTEWTSGPLSPEYGGTGDPLDDAITLGGEKWNVLEIENRNRTGEQFIDYQYQSVANPNIIFRVGKDGNGKYVGKIDISGKNGPITKETLHY